MILDAQFGTSTATNAALPFIDLGDHDPHVRGANVRNEEIVVSADVDPYVFGFLDIVYKIDEAGDSQFELEEAYGLTTSLPAGLQLKFGQFFTEFGRTNPTHPHSWEFFNYPVILGRVFGGDGLRGPGMRLSWIVPTCSRCPITLLAGVPERAGRDAGVVHRRRGGGDRGARAPGSRRRELHRPDVQRARGDELRLRRLVREHLHRGSRASRARFGPNGTGPHGFTDVYGADFTLKWKPATTDAGWPWLAWQTEAVYRDYHADAQVQQVDDGMGGFVDVPVAARLYGDWGFYSQLVYGFKRPWSIGARIDYADSDGAFAGSHFRASTALTYYPSEFSRVRLQLQYDDVQGLSRLVPGDDDQSFSVWLGFDLSLGKHGAHKF